MSWSDDRLGDYGVNAINPRLVDVHGEPVSFEEIGPDSSPQPGSKQSLWAYKVHGKQHAWPLTIKADAAITLGLPTQPSFPLDLSNPPEPGQSKEVNLDVEAEGHRIHVLSYTVDKDPNGNGVLKFSMQSDPSVIGASLFDKVNPVLGGGGGGGGGNMHGPFTGGFTYNGSLPSGKVDIAVTALMLYIDGGWTVTWQP